MRIYLFPVAPNPTRVRVYLAEKGLALEQVTVNLARGEQRSAAHLARSPLGKLPVLELDDGSFLTESLAIMELLEELHPEPPMLGRTPLERARARELERIAEMGVLHPIARLVHATRSPLGAPPSPEVAAQARRALPEGLRVLEERIGSAPFLAGERPTFADCTLFAAFGFARFGGVELDPAFERLHGWYARFSARPSAQAPPLPA
jgi:glutathione S-transferase